MTWLRALAVAIGLSLLFCVIYGGTSYITSLRSNVGTWYFAWERFIPFVPLMIIPYMSIDALFFAAPFICRDRQELRLLSWRITLGIVVAGACFLIYPLQLGTERPTPPGWLGVIWQWFVGMDRPYNLLPSLHITLRTILANLYAIRAPNLLWRYASNIWFTLVGLSTLFTYQHHVVDVLGGFILGATCLYLVRDVPLHLPMVRNSCVGWKYVTLGLALAALSWAAWPWGAILVWPIAAVTLVALGYFLLGPSIYRKQNGALPFSARVVLAPVLFGQYLSWLHYKRQGDAWNAVAPNVWIGRSLTDAEAANAVGQGVSAVVDLSDAFSEAAPFRNAAYRHLPVLDLTAPTPAHLAEAVLFIEEHASQGVVYVHCKIGYSRSAAVVGAWLLASGRAKSVHEAIAQLRAVRPAIVIRPEVREALVNFSKRGEPAT
ncbi:MAG: dual specificity protein phosphatase family protein [Pirellulales bacterium]